MSTHRNVVVDVQPDVWQYASESATDSVRSVWPKERPRSSMKLFGFALSMPLEGLTPDTTPASNENSPTRVPIETPNESCIGNRYSSRLGLEIKHAMLVAEFHDVQQVSAAITPVNVKSIEPNPSPLKVSEPVPVAALLYGIHNVSTGESYVSPAETEPATALRTIVTHRPSPLGATQRTDDTELHDDVVQSVMPITTDDVGS